MTDNRLKILLIEDNPADALLVKEMLAETRSFSCELTHVDRFEKCGTLPDRERVDIVLLDLTLPDVQGLETVVKTCDIMAGKPIVVMSGIEDEDLAIKALQEGAQDYLVKGQVDSDLLARSIRYAMERKLSEDSLWKAYTELERRVQERTAELVEANQVIRESEKKYRMLVEQASDGIFILDEDACIRDVNSTACKMLGYLPEELLKLNIRDIIPDEDLSEVPLRHREVLAGEKVVIERRFRRKNGTFISVEVSAAKLEDGRLQTIVRDLTERKKAEEAIRRSEASLAEAQRIAHIGNWDWDIQNNELYWSDEIYRILGLDPKHFRPDFGAFLSFVHPEDRELVKRVVNEALYGRPYSIDHRIVLPDNTVRLVHEEADVTFGESGEPVRMIGTIQDITRKKEREIQLIMSERLAALGQISSGIAHEINNPLAAIAACAEGLLNRIKKGRFEKEIFRNYLDIITQEVSRCKGITTSMLSFVRETTYQKKDIDINYVLDKTMELIGFQGRLKSVSVLKKYDGPLIAYGSEGEMRQVFLAVVLNALDAMENKGSLTLETGVYKSGPEGETRGSSVFVRISDTGEGISAEYAGRIFDSFFTTKSEKGGIGLGLSIANKIIKDHNGSIFVTSERGKGASFLIVLPV